MSISRKHAPYLFFATLAVSYGLWFLERRASPLWTDELITTALVKSASLKDLFSAVVAGLDATPPLYTLYGWFVYHNIVPGASAETLLRITNAGLMAGTIWLLYLSLRHFFDWLVALTTTSIFILIELWQLKFLTLEVRSYALFVFAAILAVYASLRAITCPRWLSWVWTAVAYCLLVGSHTFGIIYVVSIAACAIVAALIDNETRLARNAGLAALPAAVIFILWLPVMNYQAQLGNWIPRPDLVLLLHSILPSHWKRILLTSAPLIVLSLRNPSYTASLLIQWRQSLDRGSIFILLLPVTFVGSTFGVWIFSKLIFPVFIERYFFPNIMLHAIWLSCMLNFGFSYVTRPTARYGLMLVSGLLAGLSILYRPFDQKWMRIPCFDPSRNAYLEDPFKNGAPVVALNSHTWLTRLNRPGVKILFPVDEHAIDEKDADGRFNAKFVRQFEDWMGMKPITTTEMLDSKKDFMVLDDGHGPWFKFIQSSHELKLTLLAKMTGCELWQVKVPN